MDAPKLEKLRFLAAEIQSHIGIHCRFRLYVCQSSKEDFAAMLNSYGKAGITNILHLCQMEI